MYQLDMFLEQEKTEVIQEIFLTNFRAYVLVLPPPVKQQKQHPRFIFRNTSFSSLFSHLVSLSALLSGKHIKNTNLTKLLNDIDE